MADFAKDVSTPLEKSLQEATALVGELEGRVHIVASGGESVKLDDQDFYHGTVTIELEYTSEKPLTNLVDRVVIPGILVDYVMPHLNSGKCAVLKNMYSNDYMIARTAQIVAEDAAVMELLKGTGVPPGFAKWISGARPADMP